MASPTAFQQLSQLLPNSFPALANFFAELANCLEALLVNKGGTVSDRLDATHSGIDASIDGARDGAADAPPSCCLLIGPGTHDELEVVDAELTGRTRARRTRHHGANGLVVEPILVHALDVRLHLSGIDRPMLSRVTPPLFRKRRLQARIRLVHVLSKDSLEARRHSSLDKGGSVRCC